MVQLILWVPGDPDADPGFLLYWSVGDFSFLNSEWNAFIPSIWY